jgi:multiple sugar transport system ATP-binding protein
MGLEMADVRLKNIRKLFGRVEAVKDFSLDISDGEFIILVGPSGCGKTTTLRMIAGLETITSGEIYIGDRLINSVAPKYRDIAMVFQNYALYPHMNVFKNMAFSLRLRKVSKPETERIVRETAELLGIEELLDRKPSELSGGQRQRVALGRAIVRDPKVFLFDEPLSNLDAKLRITMRTELLDLHQRLKTTTVYVTHDQLEAMTMGDRIVVMHDGIIQQVDTPQGVYDHPANKFVAGFIGSPSMNFIDCVVAKENGGVFVKSPGMKIRIPDDKVRAIDPLSGKEAVLGLRPENIKTIPDPAGPDSGNRFHSTVWVVEPVGSEQLVYLRGESGTLIARFDPQVSMRIGDKVELAVDIDNGHIFDKHTEQAIF